MKRTNSILLPDIIFSVFVLIIVITIPVYYVSRERFFYFWDFSGYQISAVNQVNRFLFNPIYPLRLAINSLGDDYSALFTLPLIPLMAMIGNYQTRITYILSLAIAYFLPYVLVIGLLAKKLIPQHGKAVFWSAVFISLLNPTAWLPTLRGYPDTGGALLIGLAILVYLRDDRLKKAPQILLISFCIVTAIIFRRHFIYSITAFLLTVILLILARFVRKTQQHSRTAIREFIIDGGHIGSLVICILLVLLVIGKPFVEHVLSTNFRALYSSWEAPVQVVLSAYLSYYGWLAFFFPFFGLIMCIATRTSIRQEVIFIGLFGVVAFTQWIFVVRQVNPHYTLHFTLAVMLGITWSGWTLWGNIKQWSWRLISALTMSAYLVVNLTFWLVPQFLPDNPILFRLLPVYTQPLRDPNYDEIARLVAYLRTKASGGDPVYVVDSSEWMNDDLLRNAERILYSGKQILNILSSPHADSRDFYPLVTLLEAKYVVVSSPFQRHLSLQEQGVVYTTYNAFVNNWEVSKDFIVLPETFSLINGIQTRIFERTKKTSVETAIRTLYQIQIGVGPRPGGQMDWIQLDNFTLGSVSHIEDGKYRIKVQFNKPEEVKSPLTFLYLGIPPESLKITGKYQGDCSDLSLNLATATRKGDIHPFAEVRISDDGSGVFSERLFPQGAAYLLLSLSPLANSFGNYNCEVKIQDLSVSN